jgi:hypothetical protein
MIVIGSCSALEGLSQALGTQTVNGAKAYFAVVNGKGGVHGRKLRLIAYDDSYDPAKIQACSDRLMADRVFAHRPCIRCGLWVVNVRASYNHETREQVDPRDGPRPRARSWTIPRKITKDSIT